MLLKINPNNPQERLLNRVINCLERGGVIIYPTDTNYGLGCDIQNKKAVSRVCRIKGIDPNKAYLTCVCESEKVIGTYTAPIQTPVYKILKRALPGPYTFILPASKQIPRHFQHKKTVGIRVPKHEIPIRLSSGLGRPIASISLPVDEDQPEFSMDPGLIFERFGHDVDIVVSGGYGSLEVSTIIDCSQPNGEIAVLREGSGPLEPLGLVLIDE